MAIDGLNGGFDDTTLLLRIKGLIFAERPEHDEAVNAGVRQCRQMTSGCVQIQGLVFLELSRDGGEDTTPIRFVHRRIGILSFARCNRNAAAGGWRRLAIAARPSVPRGAL